MFLDPRLWQLTRGVRRRIAFAVLVGVAAATAGILRLALLGWLLGRVYRGEALDALIAPIAGVAAVMVLRGLLEHWRWWRAWSSWRRTSGATCRSCSWPR
jgi:ATP-binding cassette subfamily C protein CydCD